MKILLKNWLLQDKKALVGLLVLYISCTLTSQNIYTFAGTGSLGYTGDGGPANLAKIGNPSGICADNSGNVYFADGYYIRKVNSLGIITTIAGNPTISSTYAGDGGPATLAAFNHIEGIAIDASGNLYIADVGNQRIRKINSSGIINTIAGTGTMGYSGDGGPAVSAQISWPYDVTTDPSGNVYFTEQNAHRIRKIDPSGIISTVAGNGTPGFSGDGGLAASALIKFPEGMTTDGAGNIYFCDYGNARVRKMDLSGIISTVTTTIAHDISSDALGNIYFAWYGNTIGKINTIGGISTIAGNGISGYSGDGGLATFAQIGSAYCLVVDPMNNVYFGQQGQAATNQCIRVVCQSNCLSGVEESNNSSGFINIYPNPVSEILSIESENYPDSYRDDESTQIEILNTLGQVVFKRKFENEVDVSGLSNGIYFIKLFGNSNSNSYCTKFIKQ